MKTITNIFRKRIIHGTSVIALSLIIFSFNFSEKVSFQQNGRFKGKLPPPEKITIATNIKNTPVVSVRHFDFFESYITYIDDFDFDLRRFILHHTDSLLKTLGLNTGIYFEDISDETINPLRSRSKSKRIAAANYFREMGIDAMLFIEQATVYPGLVYQRGTSVKNHGIFVVRDGSSIFRTIRYYIVLPVSFNYYDLRTGKLISRVYDSNNKYYATEADFLTHIGTTEDVTDSDKDSLFVEYKRKYPELLNHAIGKMKVQDW